MTLLVHGDSDIIHDSYIINVCDKICDSDIKGDLHVIGDGYIFHNSDIIFDNHIPD